MVNDINNINAPQPGKPRNGSNGGVDNVAVNSSGNAGSNASAPDTNNSSADTVQLSAQAQELSRIQSDLQSAPDVDEARVSEIRDSITDGSYTVDANRLAARILADEQNFGV